MAIYSAANMTKTPPFLTDSPLSLRRRLWVEWSLIAFGVTVLLFCMVQFKWTERADLMLYDFAMENVPAQNADNIIIISIDEPSLKKLGRWPWRRTTHIPLFQQLAAANPHSVTFDILLTEPTNAEDDAALAEAMGKTDALYLPLQYFTPGSNGRDYDVITPLPIFEQEASGIGHVNTILDGDNSVRRTALCFRVDPDAAAMPHIMQMAYDTRRAVMMAAQLNGGGDGEKSADCTEPLLIHFAQPQNFTTISYANVVNGEVPAGFFNDKHVLIGAGALGLGDRYSTPSSHGSTISGVEVNANILSNIIQNDFIVPAGFGWQLLFVLIPSWIFLLALWRLQPRMIIWLASGLYFIVIATSIAALSQHIWLPPVPALVPLAIIYPLWGWRRLQATSDYMAVELNNLMDSRNNNLPIVQAGFEPIDIVTKQAEQLHQAIIQMRDLQHFVSDTLTSLPDPMMVVDGQGAILLSNDAMREMFGENPEGRHIADMLQQFVTRKDWPFVRAYLPQRLLAQHSDQNTGQPVKVQPKQMQTANSLPYVEFITRRDRSFAMRARAVISNQGIENGHIFYLADISDIKNAQAEREEILQLLSHDMRTPQAAILALLEQAKPLSDDADTRRRIAHQARRTLSLADNFVDLARMRSLPFTPELVLVGDLVQEASDLIWPIAQKRSISIQVDDQSDLAFIPAERDSLFRALVNILDNSCKYSPQKGRVSITIERATFAGEPSVQIAIADQGKGIDDSVLPDLFSKFTSDTKGQDLLVKGIGLGLHYVAMVI